jgi:hypothetical protein
MALLFCDGFEEMSKDEFLYRWSSCNDLDSATTQIQSDIKRSGDQAFRLRSAPSLYIQKNFPRLMTEFVIGFAVYHANDLDSCDGWVFWNSNQQQLTYQTQPDGSVELRRGSSIGTLLDTSGTDEIKVDQWQYIEIKNKIDNTTGTWELRVDGQAIMSGENSDTQRDTPAGVTLVRLHSNYEYTYYDDFYMLDTTGSTNNDFIGPQRVDTLVPNGSGNYTNWDVSSGENWSAVNTSGEGDALYVQTMSGEVMDTYAFENLETLSVDNIAGVQLFATARRDADTPEKLDLLARIGSSDYSGELDYLPVGYHGVTRVWEVNPDDSAQWEEADVNGAEFGIKKIDD